MPTVQQPVAPAASGVRPSAQISPFRNPVKYLQATVSEMPIGSGSRGAMGNQVVQPVAPNQNMVRASAPAGSPTPELVISVAQACERQGNSQQARLHYQRALTMWPGQVEVLRAAARMEDRLGQLPLAEHLYRQAVGANPQHAGALNDLGLCLARQGKLDASLVVLEQAVQLQPAKALYRNNAATVLVEMRQDQRALAHLVAVHGSAEANYNLGQLLVQRGRSIEATPYFIAAVEQKPDMQAAHDALAKLQGTQVTTPAETANAAAPSATAAAPATGTESVPEVAAQPAAPTATPAAGPQQTPTYGPQFEYPATARSPEFGQSSFLPPGYYPPTGPFLQSTDPRYHAVPQHLPPVASQPGSTMRR
jgi:tetratricopeptide (TPR) repeat protein